jgi:hypothetical protein
MSAQKNEGVESSWTDPKTRQVFRIDMRTGHSHPKGVLLSDYGKHIAPLVQGVRRTLPRHAHALATNITTQDDAPIWIRRALEVYFYLIRLAAVLTRRLVS